MTAKLLPARLRARVPHTPCALACLMLLAGAAQADDGADAAASLPNVVVTAVHDHSPAHVVADPKQPRQPIPASDAADYLKTIPGFSAIRSGGSNSDPVFRGQFGSRLPLLTNGTLMVGACPARMDSPSSYISPETFDVLTVVKGPQTVLWGPGTSAGVVRFDRERPDFSTGLVHFSGSLLGASAGRNDQTADLEAGSERFYLRATANRSHSQDYRDGDGHRVPSAWDKWNTDVAVGLTPDAHTLIELSAGAGNGEARYGGRGMDGTRFRRDSLALRFEKQHITPWFTRFGAQLYRNQADHVMDNFTLRVPPTTGMMAGGMAANVKRTTTGGRMAATFQPAQALSVVTGLDFSRSPLESRSGTPMQSYSSQAWQRDARFANVGVFAELAWRAQADTRWVGGLRLDRAQAWRYPTVDAGMGGMDGGMDGMHAHAHTGAGGMAMGGGAGNHRSRQAMPSGFVRWERTLAQGATAYVGIGHVQRFPDYWELISPSNSAAASGNAFATLKPEKTTQIDAGVNWKTDDWQLWASTYVGRVQDYILFDYDGMGGRVRNVNAHTAGLELGGSHRLTNAWTVQGTLAYSWGRNTTDGRALPQMPPLEARLGLDYAQGPWSAGVLWRLVAAQRRYAQGQGNVVGQDLGPSAGFGVVSAHADYRFNRYLKLALGVDNLFDKTYAEHLNLAGNSGFGYPGGVRINEPGRTLWLRADVKF